MILLATAAVGGFLAFDDPDASAEQIALATAALKRHDGTLFTHDPVYGPSGLWRLHTPIFQGVLELVLLPSGYGEPLTAFRVLAGAVIAIYLCAMYALLYHQCRSWSISAFVAVLSATVTYAPGGAFWGVGPLATIGARGLCIAFSPLIVLGLLGATDGREGREQPWRLGVIFGCAGLLCNLHLPTGVNLTLVLLIAYLARRRARPRSWLTATGGLAAAAVGALPYAAYAIALGWRIPTAQATASYATARRALAAGGAEVLYPELLKQVIESVPYVAVLLVPAGAVLVRVGRFRLRNGVFWLTMLLGAVAIGLGAHGLCQLHARAQNRPPVTLLVEAAALGMLPLYVLLAQGLTNLFRLVRTHRALLRWACVAALAAWMMPSDNLQVARHLAYRTATGFMAPASRPPRVRELAERRAARREMDALARWLRDHTDRTAIVLTDRSDLRLAARRPITASADDLPYYYRLAPGRMDAWRSRLARQRRMLARPVLRSDLRSLAAAIAARRDLPRETEILAVIPAPMASSGLADWHVEPDGWGQFFRLYRVPPAAAPHAAR